MEGEGEVVANPGDAVFRGGVVEEGVCAGAVGALHVFEFDDGDPGSGGGMEDGGVVDLGGWRGVAKLGVGAGGGKREQR